WRSAGRRRLSTSHGRPFPGSGSRGVCLDQLDLVPVGVLDERDHGAAALDRAGFAGDTSAGVADALAGGGDVRHADRDMAVGGAEIVAIDAVVVGQLEHGGIAFVAIADEGERISL